MDYTDLLGCRFKVHGRTKEEGFDCYGLAIEILKRNGIELKDAFYESLENRSDIHRELHSAIEVKKLETPEKNCIIEFSVHGEPLHVGVYIGNGLFMHITHTSTARIEQLSKYKKTVMGYYKVSNS